MTLTRSQTLAAGLALALVAIVVSVSSAQATQLTSSCDPADPQTCLYSSDLSYTPGVVDDIVLVDEERYDYEVPLLVRYPVEATDPRPVVIWNHGGSPSESGRNRSAEWGETLARAGYVVIHPSRAVPDDVTPHLRECRLNGIPDSACPGWIAQLRYGPKNTSFIIDRLSEIVAERPELGGRMDASKIVVAGHSAGTSTVLANAGAEQQWLEGGPIHREVDPRPIAFMATAPQGPTYAGYISGFDEARSFLEIDRPFLFVTGMGDVTGEPIPTRLTAWITSQPGNKALVWDTDPEAVHETMDIDVDKCDTPVRADHCLWIASVGTAYLDAVVRHRPEAISWLRSNDFETATGGAIELHHR